MHTKRCAVSRQIITRVELACDMFLLAKITSHKKIKKLKLSRIGI